tara:strand:- start:471 stop:1490 length:1020 start_codon:yes stop_codon:yes gene_type:complete
MNLQQIKKKLNNNAEAVFKKLGMKCEVFSDNIYSTCPVHEDSDNPRAFSFSLQKGIWKCWTRDCQQEHRNDIFGLIQGTLSNQAGTNVEFKDVLKWIKEEFNIISTRSDSEVHVEEDDEDFASIIKFMNQTCTCSQDKAIELEYQVSKPSDYFAGRGFKKSTLKYFDVGDCYEQGIMKERSIIPIHNDDGELLVGIIGRSIKEYRMPKFLISPKGFNKRNYFYNYHRAVNKAEETSCLYILEGQGDVWKLHEAGVRNAVSVFGKSISKEQAQKIKKLAVTHLIVLMDNDQAGREARVQMKRDFGRMYKLTFPKLSDKDVGDMSVYKIKKDILSELKGTY